MPVLIYICITYQIYAIAIAGAATFGSSAGAKPSSQVVPYFSNAQIRIRFCVWPPARSSSAGLEADLEAVEQRLEDPHHPVDGAELA